MGLGLLGKEKQILKKYEPVGLVRAAVFCLQVFSISLCKYYRNMNKKNAGDSSNVS